MGIVLTGRTPRTLRLTSRCPSSTLLQPFTLETSCDISSPYPLNPWTRKDRGVSFGTGELWNRKTRSAMHRDLSLYDTDYPPLHLGNILFSSRPIAYSGFVLIKKLIFSFKDICASSPLRLPLNGVVGKATKTDGYSCSRETIAR